jgi:hypothetical protein
MREGATNHFHINREGLLAQDVQVLLDRLDGFFGVD